MQEQPIKILTYDALTDETRDPNPKNLYRLLLNVPVVIGAADIWTEPLDIFGFGCLDISITEERKSILVSVNVVVIFEAGILDRLEEVDSL
jgi:hypothetical protein